MRRVCKRQTRNTEPNAPSSLALVAATSKDFADVAAARVLGLPSSARSGATRRSQPMVLIAPASFNDGLCRVVMRIVVKFSISASACFDIFETNLECGYSAFRRFTWACKSSADEYDVAVFEPELEDAD